MNEYLTVKELSDLLGLPADFVLAYVRKKKIPLIRTGAVEYRYDKEAVKAALAKDGISWPDEKNHRHNK